MATPVLDRLARAACEAGCAVFLSDAEGLVLEERMRDADRRAFHRSNLAPGSDWSEGQEGTNGIGTCLAEGRPVTVWRDQHFRATNTGLTCMGAPVFGARGELAGVIDVSSAREDMTEGYARLVALTVQDAASRIEADLFRASFEGARILSTGAAEESPQGVVLLALDRDDLVIGATRAARRQPGPGGGADGPGARDRSVRGQARRRAGRAGRGAAGRDGAGAGARGRQCLGGGARSGDRPRHLLSQVEGAWSERVRGRGGAAPPSCPCRAIHPPGYLKQDKG
ncbi:GAF domain-containing protein [Rhodobacter capsulatus]|uniref:GAF domain-containing protein n=1 Tax=Rhodobacter capsulatus TaxID=1061 RepID=UPI004026B451